MDTGRESLCRNCAHLELCSVDGPQSDDATPDDYAEICKGFERVGKRSFDSGQYE